MDQPPIPRKSERKPVTIAAQCRTQSGLRDVGRIVDLSAEGCCVITNALFVKVGARVMIKPEGMEGISGCVRWIEGTKAGVSFDTPLYGPIVDHMSARFGTELPVAISQA